jgi:membrane fusion protein, heavy metal efflux system
VQGGRVTSAGREWPTLGAKVRRGQVLLRLTPTGSGAERATSAAESARVTQELARARADLARLEGLEGVVSRAELEAARSQVASLAAQRTALSAPLGSGESLVSPIDGVIAAIDASPGAVVEPGQSLVTVIDPARLSVEALAFEPVIGGVGAISRATVALHDGTSLAARVEGIGSQLKGGAIPVRLNLTSVASGLAVGQPVVVLLERTVTAPGLNLPVDALVRAANGERIVYEKVSAERYMPRTVRVRQVSADRIAVVSGLAPDARVVVVGAPLLSQIR